MEIKEIKIKIIDMADRIWQILGLIEKGFMENRLEPLSDAIKEENLINEAEKILTKNIIELSKTMKSVEDKQELMIMEQMVETLESMGDEAANIIERIEIKVIENLLFSDLGVRQFNETFSAMKKSVEMMREFLNKKNPELKERVIDNGFHVKGLYVRGQ